MERGRFYLLRRMTPYFMKHKGILLFDLFCAGLTTASEMILPIMLRKVTNLGIRDIGALTGTFILKLAIFYLILKVIDISASYFMASIGHIMGAKIETNMRSDIYRHLQEQSNSFFDEAKIGHIMSRITNDLFEVTEFAHHCPEEYFIGLLKIIVSFLILVRMNTLLTVLIFLMIPIMVVMATFFRRRMRRAQANQRKQIGNLNASIEDSLTGIRIVKSFANEDMERNKFERENRHFLNIKKDYYKSMAGFVTVTKVFDGFMYFILLVLGAVFMMQGKIQPGDMIAYAMYVSMLLATVKRIVEFTEQFQRGMTGIERFDEIMRLKTEIKDRPGAKAVSRLHGEIVFDKVNFHYKNDDVPVLKNFSLHIPQGKNIAIVGPSGSGKTTICNLIPRFYDVTDGRILVDGHDVRDLTLKSLRDNIGIVQQDIYLFSGSIRDNIAYGRQDATPEEVEEAAKLAGAYDFIMALPQGFDTYVGERGVMLSGGQKQRISIARVFLKNPPVLILDEATSALDNRSEQIVQESVELLSEGRTTLTIAHRLTTVRDADEIIVMNDGGIVERGNHETLMAAKGAYYDLYTKGGMLTF
ncbi:MAG: ABC transporter ATP-binding protein [Eubacteriales bacterium]|nr:ABC transporter ATP-binding protein [Eubacteriales bacterium]